MRFVADPTLVTSVCHLWMLLRFVADPTLVTSVCLSWTLLQQIKSASENAIESHKRSKPLKSLHFHPIISNCLVYPLNSDQCLIQEHFSSLHDCISSNFAALMQDFQSVLQAQFIETCNIPVRQDKIHLPRSRSVKSHVESDVQQLLHDKGKRRLFPTLSRHLSSGEGSKIGTYRESTYTKIGTIQRRLAWPLRKDDTQIREAFHVLA
ncbi:hypothetical protein Y1Q_0012619 [Alligator mississippiensis]|uniref:Uncharacterized protein n=1 Tax=Alligator mississippiensis TaxID=8496 RepID=A0A151M8A9_ALLMI|nr:hypothetical protein Y1Q_0012619 [Alligator mississippiensis]